MLKHGHRFIIYTANLPINLLILLLVCEAVKLSCGWKLKREYRVEMATTISLKVCKRQI